MTSVPHVRFTVSVKGMGISPYRQQCLPLVPNQSQKNPVQILPLYFFLRPISILSFHLNLCFPSCLFLWGKLFKYLYSLYAALTAHLIPLHKRDIRRGVHTNYEDPQRAVFNTLWSSERESTQLPRYSTGVTKRTWHRWRECYVGFEALEAVAIKSTVFWVGMPYISETARRFGRTYHLHHQGRKESQASWACLSLFLAFTLIYYSTLKIEAAFYRNVDSPVTAWHHIPEQSNIFFLFFFLPLPLILFLASFSVSLPRSPKCRRHSSFVISRPAIPFSTWGPDMAYCDFTRLLQRRKTTVSFPHISQQSYHFSLLHRLFK
jgi:hypothetical protein